MIYIDLKLFVQLPCPVISKTETCILKLCVMQYILRQ